MLLKLLGLAKTAEWNNDPRSQQLAALLTEAAFASLRGDLALKSDKERETIKLMLLTSKWTKKEACDRLVHAPTLVNWSGLPREVYYEAKRISKELYISLGKSW